MAGEASDVNSPAEGSDGTGTGTGSGQQPQAKKRRTGPAATGRGVANLTPEQLARKRANDREAQRAIRERTKSQIDSLNRRIRDLESQQPYHDLQLVIREKDAIVAENADIRKRLESVVSIIQPILRPSAGLNELAAAAARSPLPTPLVHHHPSLPPDPRTFNSTLGEIAASPPNGVIAHGGADSGRPWPFPSDAPTSHVRRWPGDGQHYPQERPSHMSSEMPLDERMGVDFLLENNGQRRYVDPQLHPPQQQPTITTNGVGQHAPILVPYLTLPRNTTSTCPLDAMLLNFLGERQTRAAAGDSMAAVVGPQYPNLTALKFKERGVESHPLSKLLTDILGTFPDISGLPEKVAIVYVMFLFMRWQIDPTQENYDRLPDWFTPRASQLFVPHPVWIDHVPWPRCRDRLINTQPESDISFEDFFIPFTTTVSVNWPYEPEDCILPASKVHLGHSSASSLPASSPYSTAVHAGSPVPPMTPQPAVGTPGTIGSLRGDDDQYLINPAFESHLRNLNNWSLGPSFRAAFPTLGPTVRIKEGR
ncbi:hypothetical protein K458DRAFT_343262 [Lentithecium fluviatile CBS 122367]|uniref:BZIP transcription factor n=1 Tax=Lentithecium fluviatile CBS 122367 TaxID=1168545 RepID=A0A6G1ITV1_9PLEO|nr:hypothetical protein K458DRAFT_343262 [Lentithecium fluviatile CBS 122367]